MPFFNGEILVRHTQYREAIATVSLSHQEDCVCLVCSAARGDEEAFMEIVISLERDYVKKSDMQVREDVADETRRGTG